MSTQFAIPAVGSQVTVTVTHRHFSGYGTVDKVFTGVVVPNNKWDDPTRFFTVNDGNPDWPSYAIPIEWVSDLKYSDGSVASKRETDTGVKTWTVDGSKPGTKYTVTKKGNHVTCSCPAYTFRKSCKHTAIANN